ncbi:LGFP repeat-containing protein [Demequina silvatica]|uniref:LGFP repeat-containing protein n=1 Tax=Demequina silvatica TaxID=1638988 RepID=UPI0007833050|nr:hypothetical protein [Demequina silvatica]
MTAMPRTLRRALLLAAATLAGAVAFTLGSTGDAKAADGSDFDPGMIIADSLFFDGDAMTISEIQGFLNGKVATCQSGYTCLKNYKQTTTDIPADAFCKGYTGAKNQSAATMIRKVGKSCGVSQKVLLVLIQKEQGLVTHTWPSQYRYDKLTGYACPDTDSCNPAYAGFMKQLYYGARQYKVYAAYPGSYNYRFGETNRIYYAPPVKENGSWVYKCGSVSVYIENQATAGLYNYTPYVPNRAALDNLYGTGDSCSAYGNRNFWRLYTDWFGSTKIDPKVAIAKERKAQGGADGWLGAAVGPVRYVAATGAYYREFEGSVIAWTPEHGAQTVGKLFIDKFRKLGGVGTVGLPTDGVVRLSANGGGRYQEFTAGTLLRTLKGTHEVDGGMLSYYWGLGGPKSDLGWPTGAKTKHDGPYWTQEFTGGRVYSNIATLAYVGEEFLDEYVASGELDGTLGWPTSDVVKVSANGGGSYQTWASATLYASQAGAFKVSSGMLTYYTGLGGPTSDLGWPTDVKRNPESGLFLQDFTGGRVYSDASTLRYIGDEFLDLYLDGGGLGGPLGWPTTDVVKVAANGGGTRQEFGGTVMYASPAGAYALTDDALAGYLAEGGPGGALGWPAGEAETLTVGGGGTVLPFTKGSIYERAAGTFVVRGAMHGFYVTLGGPASALGWPTSDKQFHSGPYWTQDFVGGVLYSDLTHLGYVPASTLDAYEAAGGPSGLLGWPTGKPTSYTAGGGGISVPFSGGVLYQSSHGTQPVRGAMLTEYVSMGGPASTLGWPTGDKVKHAGPYWTQDFTGGRLYSDSSHLGYVAAALLDTYERYGEVGGKLGWPTGDVKKRKFGTQQSFQKGDLFVSSAGGFAVDGRMRNYYASIGGPASKLGWPAGEKVWKPGPVWTQRFTGGVMRSNGSKVTHTLR